MSSVTPLRTRAKRPTAPAESSRTPAVDCAQRREIAEDLVLTGQGDRAAFRRLYSAVSRFVFGILLTVLRDRAIADDVAQEVFVAIWRRASSFDPEKGNPQAWIASITRNRAIDRLRADRARGFVTFTDELPELGDDRADPALSMDALALRRAMADLKPEYRKALVLAYFNGYTHSELAAVLDVPVGTAKSWVRRGLSAMREALE